MKLPMMSIAAGLLALAFATAAAPTPAPEPTTTPTPQRLLALIRNKFRSHRPPPPYVSYTIERKQSNDRGFADYANSYTDKVWLRSSDRAALGRRVYPYGGLGPAGFQRPAFNEARDPGPPTADVFEAAPPKPTKISDVPTPEPLGTYVVIGNAVTVGEYDYAVDAVTYEGQLVHLMLRPVRDPERNRLREVYADRQTYEVTRILAHDRLFDGDGRIYGVIFDLRMGVIDGHPVATSLHGVVGDGYTGDGKDVDYQFRDIKFPATMPDWYFDARSYAAHTNDLPLK
jgi:hypothetical protein